MPSSLTTTLIVRQDRDPAETTLGPRRQGNDPSGEETHHIRIASLASKLRTDNDEITAQCVGNGDI
jgi:hypothetical protein